MQRRKFLRTTTHAGLGLSLFGLAACGDPKPADAMQDVDSVEEPATEAADLWFNISLAQWSLNKAIFGGQLDHLDFAKTTREDFGLSGIEYVNQFFMDKAKNMEYLKQMNQRAADHDVKQLLIMCDGEGDLGDTNAKARMQAVENHYKWVDAAKFLGCHSIRVNAAGKGTREEVAKSATDGLAKLSEYGKQAGLNVLVENHGSYSSDGAWLSGVIAATGMDNCGTLPDFGNFCIERGDDGCKNEYDLYKGMEELMPYAKAISAKTYNFDAEGKETKIDYVRVLKTIKDNGYRGWIGIEYEGETMEPEAGIRATIELLRKAGSMV